MVLLIYDRFEQSEETEHKCHLIGDKLLPMLPVWIMHACLKLDGY